MDAIQLILNTFSKFLDYPSSFWLESQPTIDCSSIKFWSYGKDVYQYFEVFLISRSKKLDDLFYRKFINTSVKHAITGSIEFNDEGDRIESLYQIINIQNGQIESCRFLSFEYSKFVDCLL